LSQRANTIWIISKYACSARYGFETRHFALAREFHRQGRQPLIIASDSNHLASFPRFGSKVTEDTSGEVRTLWLKTLKYARTISPRRVLSWLDFERRLYLLSKNRLPAPDVIIVSSLSLLTILNGIRLRNRYACKLIFEVRDIWPLTLVHLGGYSPRNPLVRLLGWVEKTGYRRADLVVGTMPNLSAHVSAVAGEHVRCECIPAGYAADAARSLVPEGEDATDHGLPEGKFIVGYAGSIGLANALDTIIACVERLAGDDRFHFVFLGSGGRRDELIAQTRELGNVTFLPRVEREHVNAVLQRCDVLYFAVHESPLWEFGMSLNKMIDYMLAGKPILASYGGYRSMIDEADCGEFVPPGDTDALQAALLRYAELPNEALREKGQAGRRWLLENRSWQVLARDYLGLCDSLCNEEGVGDDVAN